MLLSRLPALAPILLRTPLGRTKSIEAALHRAKRSDLGTLQEIAALKRILANRAERRQQKRKAKRKAQRRARAITRLRG